jgi:hypothetical protein
LKCQYFAGAYLDNKKSVIPDVANKADEMLENVIQKVLDEADAVKDDEYCKSAIFDAISLLMCKVGQFERASNVIELITVDIIRQQALAKFAEEKRTQIIRCNRK